tara:strand:- start:439 stop:1191 length:753 start_codon:yes stop_codon:yes gene_type:complete
LSARANIFLATPCYGGWLSEDYFHSVLELQKYCNEQNISLRIQTLAQESLITRARNTLVANFLDDKNATHLLFVDADIGFPAESITRYLDYDKEVICAPYPMKMFSWDLIPKLIEQKKDWQNLCHPYVLNFKDRQKINIDKGFVEVLDAATGFLLIQRKCLEKMVDKYPDLYYKTDQILNGKEFNSKNTYLFFDTMKDEDERYLSEDYAFSRRWQKIGGTIYADIGSELTHYGNHRYKGHLWKHFDFKKD